MARELVRGGTACVRAREETSRQKKCGIPHLEKGDTATCENIMNEHD